MDREEKSSDDRKFDREHQNFDLIKEIQLNNHKDFWLTEYQCIISQFTKYVGLYFLVFIVYLGIQGFLLLVFIGLPDLIPDFPESISKLLITFSIVCSILFFYCLRVATEIVNKLSIRKKNALSELNIKTEVGDEFSIGTSATYVYCYFNIGLLIILFKLFFEVI